MSNLTIPATATLRVPCTSTVAHVFLRPSDCEICGGTGWRRAATVEYLWCENGHELMLDLSDRNQGPTLDGHMADDADDDGMVWACPWAHCDDSIALDLIGGE